METNLEENLPAVLCDASQIQQVALNLALNAAEATHGGSERRVVVSTFRGDGMVVLTALCALAAPLYRRWYHYMRRAGADERP